MILAATFALAAGQAEFDAGNTAYAAGDLAGAEAKYRAALQAGGIDADVYYNLGNVLYRQDHVAPAVLAWRRAGALAPRDPDVDANLDFARRKLTDHLEVTADAPVFAPWQAELTPDEGEWLAGACVGVGLLALGLRRRLHGVPMVPLGAVAVLGGLLLGAGAVAADGLPPGAVVLADSVTARSDLGGGVDLFTLHAGAEVRAVERSSGQALVALPDGRKGWVAEGDLGWIDPWAAFPG